MTINDDTEHKAEPDKELEAFQNMQPQLHRLPACPTEILLTIDETAVQLNVPRRTLDNWRWQKIGPPWIKVAGKTVRYRMSDILEWLEKKTVRP